MQIKILQGSYSAEDAEHILINCDDSIQIAQVEEVYYPYKLIRYDLEVGKKRLSKLNKKANCIIDLVCGRPAEASGEPSYELLEVDENEVLKAVLEEEQIAKVGHDFVLKLFLNKAKLLHTPEITIEEEAYFHKKFYVFHCKDPEENDYFVLVDAIDGGISILDR